MVISYCIIQQGCVKRTKELIQVVREREIMIFDRKYLPQLL